MVINTVFKVSGTTYDPKDLVVNKNISEYEASSNFIAEFDSPYGRHSTDFNVGNEVNIFADQNAPSIPVSHYLFNQSGTTIIDEIGNQTDTATAYNGEWTTGLIGSAFTITSGVSDYISIPNTVLSGVSDFTFNTWAKINPGSLTNHSDFDKNYTFISSLKSPNDYWVLVQYSPYTKNYRLEANDFAFSTTQGLPNGSILENGSWNMFTFTRTGSLGQFYVNNNFIGSGIVSGGTLASASGGIIIGQKEIGLAGNLVDEDQTFYCGTFDNMRFYNRPLTGSQINLLYASGNSTEKNEGAVNSLFTGTVETKQFIGKENSQRLILRGRDYTSRLKDVTVQPVVYTDSEVSTIVTNIMNNEVPELTTNNVNVTSVTLPRIAFNHNSVFDALKQLAELSNFYFYVDNDKDLHFEERKSTSSNITFDNTNIVKTSLDTTRESFYNQVWVYGDRQLTGVKEIFTQDATLGSVVNLTYKPHNTQLDRLGTVLRGGVFEMTQPSSTSGLDYLVSFQDKQIIFVSGTTQGYSSIPPNGGSVIINYQRSVPIVKFGQNDTSVQQFKPKEKVIIDKSIKDPKTAEDILKEELKNSDPLNKLKTEVRGWYNLTPGNTARVTLSDFNIDKDVVILNTEYNFNKKDNLSEDVISVTLDNKPQDLTDQLVDINRRLQKIEAGDADESALYTRLQFSNGSLLIVGSHFDVYSRKVNDSFLVGHPINGVLGEITPNFTGSIIDTNGSASWAAGSLGFGFDKSLQLKDKANVRSVALGVSDTDLLNNFTFCGWHNGSFGPGVGSSVSDSFMAFYIADEDPGISVLSGTSTGYRLRISARINGTDRSVNSSDNLLDNQTGSWNHYAGTYDGNTLAVYLNGSMVGSNTFVGSNVPNGDAFRIGLDDNNRFLYGFYDDIRLYNRALTQNELGSLVSKIDYPRDRLYLYYKLDENTGSLVYNSASKEMPTGDAVAHWRFNESGTFINAVDNNLGVSGQLVNATLNRGVYGVGSGYYGVGSYDRFFFYAGDTTFNVNGSIYPGSSFLAASGAGLNYGWAIGAWINSNGLGIGPSGTNQTIIGGRQGDNVVFRLSNGSGLALGTDDSSISTGDLTDVTFTNNWNHVGVNWKLNSRFDTGSPFYPYAEFYVNGSLMKTGSYLYATGTPTATNNNGSIYIGWESRSATAFNGKIDEVRVHYNRFLTSGEWRSLFEGKTIQPLLGDRRSSLVLEASGGHAY